MPMSTIVDETIKETINKPYKDLDMADIEAALQAPTPREVVEWIGQSVWKRTDGTYSALALAHTDARFHQNRLDEVVGMFNWQSNTRVDANLLMVGIGIRHPQTDEWVWKWDTGEDKKSKDGKSKVSDGFKRAGYQWGMARDLYALPKPRCQCKGKTEGTKHSFKGWIDSPWAIAESGETGRSHVSQVERGDPTDVSEHTVEYIPARSTTFYTIAYNKLDIEKDQAWEILAPFINKDTGEIDYAEAIMALETNLPPDDRDFTKQQKELEGIDAQSD